MVSKDHSIRTATPNDAAGIDALLEASYPVLMASAYDESVLAPALKVMMKSNSVLLSSGTFYVAVSQRGLVVGCGGWTLERPGTNKIEARLGHVRHFGTRPAWTLRGVGRAIYSLCETAAYSAGVRTFECYSSLGAEAFYASLGFKRIRKINVELAPAVELPSVLMRRHIQIIRGSLTIGDIDACSDL